VFDTRGVGFNNPSWTWSELEATLSGRAGRDGRAPGSPSWNAGGDGPAWSRRRQPFETELTRRPGAVPYAELHCHSNFSFLDGASHPEELATEAARLGLEALAVTDHDGLYGVVRFAEAAREVGLPTVFGSELTLSPDPGRAVGPRRSARLRPQRRPRRAGGAGRGRVRRHQQRALRHPGPAPPGHRAGRGAGPPQPRRARSVAAGRCGCAPALGRRAGPPLRPLPRCGRAGRRDRPGRAFDLSLVAPSLPPFPCPLPRRAAVEMQYLRRLVDEGGRRRYGYAQDRDDLSLRARAWAPDRPRARRHRAAGLPRLLPRGVGHRRVLPSLRHLLPGPGLGRQLGGLLRAGHHHADAVSLGLLFERFLSPSATARPTSTSTSRATGARRSSSTSTSATAATTPPRWPTSSPTGPGRRCATWPRRSATPPASRTPGQAGGRPGGHGGRHRTGQPDRAHTIPAGRARAGELAEVETRPGTSASTPAAW
jgi:hypothetical protein